MENSKIVTLAKKLETIKFHQSLIERATCLNIEVLNWVVDEQSKEGPKEVPAEWSMQLGVEETDSIRKPIVSMLQQVFNKTQKELDKAISELNNPTLPADGR